MSERVEQILRDRDEACRPELARIGSAIGYGNSCRILGELWDAHLVATYGPGFEGRGRMERRPEVEALEAAEARAERYRKALEELVGIVEIVSVMPDAIRKHALIAWNDPALERARAALRGEG